MTTKKSLLFITPVLPEVPSSGGLITTLEKLEILSRQFDVTVLAIEASAEAQAVQKDRFGLRNVMSAGKLRPRTVCGWLRSLLSSLPFPIWRNTHPDFLIMAEKVSEQAFDMTYVDHWLMWPAAQKVRVPGRRVLNLHNAEHLLFSRAAERSKFPFKQILAVEARRAAAYLHNICLQADEVHFLSKVDAEEVLKLTGFDLPHSVFLPWVPLEEGDFGQFGRNLLFVGTMSWAPNAEGARWYCDKVIPLLPKGYRTHIAGGYVNGIDPIRGDLVVWHGRVPDLTPLYQQASVFVAPLLSGSGIKIKILNALGRGLPVVTTTLGAEGFPTDWGSAVSIADEPEAFVAAVEQLCTNKEMWHEARNAAKDYLARHFSSGAFDKWTSQHT